MRQRAPEAVWRSVARIVQRERKTDPGFAVHRAFGLGDIKEIIQRRDNAQEIMPRFLDPENGFATQQGVVAALDEIMRVRHPMAHGRTRGNKALVNAAVETFELLIATQQALVDRPSHLVPSASAAASV